MSTKKVQDKNQLIEWVEGIETRNEVIELDFDQIEKDLTILKEKAAFKCKELFYPNIEHRYSYQDDDAWRKDQNLIEEHYKPMYGGTPSIIHYILYNKSFLFNANDPQKQNKLSNDSLSLIRSQSISILRLLLHKLKIINVTDIFEVNEYGNEFIIPNEYGNEFIIPNEYGNEFIIPSIEEYLRKQLIERLFDDPTTKASYLDLVIDIHSISDNIQQHALINILLISAHSNEPMIHLNFFDSIEYKRKSFQSVKMSPTLIKELLFRGIPPFQIVQYNQSFFEMNPISISFDLEKMAQGQYELDDLRKALTKDDAVACLKRLRATTAPLIIYDLFVAAKQDMFECLSALDIITDDCVHCVLNFLFIGYSITAVDDDDMVSKLGVVLNYMLEIHGCDKFTEQYVTLSMAQYLFSEIDAKTQKIIFEEMLFDQMHADVCRAFLKLVSLRKMPKAVFKMFMEVVFIKKCDEFIKDEGILSTVFNIIAVHIFDDNQLEDEQFMTQFIQKNSKPIVGIFERGRYAESIDAKIRVRQELIRFVDDICSLS